MKFTFDPLANSYPSRRNLVYGKKGMVATANPLAAQAGLEILKKGGNAIDAAIASAATLTVVEPTANGIGGDAFALVWTNGKLHGLNASGPAPTLMTAKALRDRGHSEMPAFGILPGEEFQPGRELRQLRCSRKAAHTIIPGFLSKDGQPVGPFGIMGGFMQPQAHLQVIVDTVDYGMNPQEALDRPRWMWVGQKTIEVEQGFDNRLANQLLRAGHDIVVKASSVNFGRGEIIWRNEDGVLCGAAEPRSDGTVAVW